MELQEMTSITFMEEVLMPFCLQRNDDYLCITTKDNSYILIDEYSHINHINYFNAIRTKVSCPKNIPTKEVASNTITLFDKGSLNEKQALLLDQTLLPGNSVPHIQSMKSLISPYDVKNPVLLAYLSTFGGLEISVRKNKTEWKQIADISKLRIVDKVDCSIFANFRDSVSEILMESLEWCYKIFHNTRYLLIKTKSDQFLIYSFEANEQKEVEIKLCYSQKINGMRLLKWVSTINQDFLFLTDEFGNMNSYKIKMEGDDIAELNHFEEVPAKLKLPASFMAVVITNKHILIVCCKSHSLEAYCFDETGKFLSSVVQYVGLSITGIEKIGSSMNFLAVTVDGKVFCIRFKIQAKLITVTEKSVIPTSIHHDRFAAYGIASSKNQVLFYLALYPKKNFDHLVLRQPLALQLNRFMENSPHEILINNSSLKLTDYYDCLELVWFMGAKDNATLEQLENIPFEIKINEKFAYYLKLQLIVLSAKFTFFRCRSDLAVQELNEQILFLTTLIEAISCVPLLNSIHSRFEQKKTVPVAPIAIKAARCLRLFLRSFLDTAKIPTTFISIFGDIEISFNTVLNRTKSLKNAALDPCSICQENIKVGQICCSAGHQTLRCIVTKLPLPLFTKNICKHCHKAHLDLETLKIVTFNQEDCLMCPLCDVLFD